MKHEHALLTEIITILAKAAARQMSEDERVTLEKDCARAIGSAMMMVERYPDLKANHNFLQLQAAMKVPLHSNNWRAR